MSGMKAGQGVARPPPKTPNEASPGPSTPTVEAAGPNKPAAATTKGKCWFIPYEAIIAVCVVLVCGVFMRYNNMAESPETRIFHPQQLRLFDGIGHNPAYMAIVGEVFDVSKEPTLYGKGGPYNCFVGKEGTRAFGTGNLKYDLNDETENLSNEQLADIFAWREYYRKKYQMKGKLGGPFYKREDGKATKYLARQEQKAATAKSFAQRQQEEVERFPTCATSHTNEGVMVSCGEGHIPRRVFRLTDSGTFDFRCACQDGVMWPEDPRAPYPDCHPTASSCLDLQAGSAQHTAAEPKDEL